MAINGNPTREDYDNIRRLSNSHAIAAQNMENLAKAAGREVERLTGEIARLNAELLAAQNSLMLLSADGTTRYDAANDEVQRLRELCIANGIDPNI
jgi:hypothetical protein